MSRRHLLSSCIVPASVLAMTSPAATAPTEEDTAMPLWRKLEAARLACAEIGDRVDALYHQMGQFKYPHVVIGYDIESDPQTGERIKVPRRFMSEREIDSDRNGLLVILVGGEARQQQIIAKYEGHKKELAEAQAEHERLRREFGLDVLEERDEAAMEAEQTAENALIAHGFDSPVSIVAGLHRFAVGSEAHVLYEWPAIVLRSMVEPMLDRVPTELADAFREEWPLRMPEDLAV